MEEKNPKRTEPKEEEQVHEPDIVSEPDIQSVDINPKNVGHPVDIQSESLDFNPEPEKPKHHHVEITSKTEIKSLDSVDLKSMDKEPVEMKPGPVNLTLEPVDSKPVGVEHVELSVRKSKSILKHTPVEIQPEPVASKPVESTPEPVASKPLESIPEPSAIKPAESIPETPSKPVNLTPEPLESIPKPVESPPEPVPKPVSILDILEARGSADSFRTVRSKSKVDPSSRPGSSTHHESTGESDVELGILGPEPEAEIEDIEEIVIPGRTVLRDESEGRHYIKNCCNFFLLYWKYILLVSWPILLTGLFIFGRDKKMRCLYVELLMYGYWTFDILPEAIVALLPIILLPMMLLQPSYITCGIYFQYGFFSMLAIMMAVAIHYSGLHERLILHLIYKFGGSPRAVHAVISVMTGIFSIRTSNAYAVQLVLPLINKILYEIDLGKFEESLGDLKLSTINFKKSEKKQEPVNMTTAFMCGLIHASTIGGMTYVSGTLPNIVFKACFQRRFPNCPIEQVPWTCYALPIVVISLIASLIWVQIVFLGLWRHNHKVLKEYNLLSRIFKEEKIVETLYYRQGNITIREICIAIAFIFYLCIWYMDFVLYFLDIKENIILFIFIEDSTPFLLITLILTFLPANLKFLYACSSKHKRPKTRSQRLMSWEIFQPRIPWGRILALGASVAMAQAQFDSGLAKELASHLAFMKNYHYWGVLFIITLFTNIMTETVSNGILCGVFAPTLIEFAILSEVHPIYIGLPFTLTCSMSFLTQQASPNIKSCSEHANLSPKDLFYAGFFPKIYGWLLIYLTFDTYGKTIFHENAIFPKDFLATNVTCYCPPCPFQHTTGIRDW